jgi:hypothetical protein
MEPSLPVPPGARQVRVPAARLSKWLDGFAARHGALTATAADHQVMVVAEDSSIAWIEVPFPPLDLTVGLPLTELVRHVSQSRRIGVLLVRRGGYAAGVFDGTDLVRSKVGSAYVQGATSAGGWSQQRFARRRDNQARAAFAEAADVAARILLPAAPSLDAVFCGGDRTACDAVLADRRLAPLRVLAQPRLLSVPDPRLRVLQSSPELFLAVQISLQQI